MKKAKMFMDFNNPISCAYSEYALKSWEPVKHLIEIEPVQCVTPNTEYFDKHKHLFHPAKKRSPSEIAILLTYKKLWEQRLSGEDFITLEHDAYLYPERITFLERILDIWDELKVIVPGGAIEFMYLHPRVIKRALKFIHEDHKHPKYRGPMGLISEATFNVCKDLNVVWPVSTKQHRFCQLNAVAREASHCARSGSYQYVSLYFPSICAQAWCSDIGNTKEDNKDWYLVEDPVRWDLLNRYMHVITKEQLYGKT